MIELEASIGMDLSNRLGSFVKSSRCVNKSNDIISRDEEKSRINKSSIERFNSKTSVSKLTHLILITSASIFLYQCGIFMCPQVEGHERGLEQNSSLAQAPSQLFLPSPNQLARPIVLVNGFIRKTQEEEEEGDGFIMQASAIPAKQSQANVFESSTDKSQAMDTESTDLAESETQTATTVTVTTTTTTTTEPTTTSGQKTFRASDEQDLDRMQEIAIDSGRQRYLTHDQLSASNESNLRQNNDKTHNNNNNNNQKVPTSRSGMSKVSQVSSFISGKLFNCY